MFICTVKRSYLSIILPNNIIFTLHTVYMMYICTYLYF